MQCHCQVVKKYYSHNLNCWPSSLIFVAYADISKTFDVGNRFEYCRITNFIIKVEGKQQLQLILQAANAFFQPTLLVDSTAGEIHHFRDFGFIALLYFWTKKTDIIKMSTILQTLHKERDDYLYSASNCWFCSGQIVKLKQSIKVIQLMWDLQL